MTIAIADRYLVRHKDGLLTQGNNFLKGQTRQSPISKTGLGTFVCVGQSLCAGSINGDYVPINPANQQIFNFLDGCFYAPFDPMLGSTGTLAVTNRGSQWMDVGDRLIAAGTFQNLLWANGGVGGTSLAEWANGVLRDHILTICRRLTDKGYPPTAILWQQGTSNRLSDQASCETWLTKIINTYRAEFNIPIYLAIETRNGTLTGTGLPAAIAALAAAHPSYIKVGADTDSIDETHRHDGVHLSAASGRGMNAEMWKDIINADY